MKFNIGENIKQIRQQFNMSQKELSKVLKIPQSKLSKIENNELSFDMVYLILDICSIFNISIGEFFCENNDSTKYNPYMNKIKKLSDHQLSKLVEFIESLTTENE